MRVAFVSFAVEVADEWSDEAVCDWLDAQLSLTAIEVRAMDVRVQRDPWPEQIEGDTPC